MVRSIGSFILASDKDRLRPSDFTAGVRGLRGEPQHKIAEWASRFVAMGWLQPEDENKRRPRRGWSSPVCGSILPNAANRSVLRGQRRTPSSKREAPAGDRV